MSLDRLSLRALVNQRLAMSLSMTSMLDEALADLLGLGAPDSEADGLYLACPLIPRLPSSRRTDRRISPLGHVPGQSLSEVGDCPPMLARSAGSRVLRQAFSPAPGRQRAVRRVPVADCRQRRKRLGGQAGQQGAASRGVGGSRPSRLAGVREFSGAAPGVDRSLARKLAASALSPPRAGRMRCDQEQRHQAAADRANCQQSAHLGGVRAGPAADEDCRQEFPTPGLKDY
jgi:hypothetical protein